MKKTILIHVHPQMTYIVRILSHLSRIGDSYDLYFIPNYAPLQQLNRHFISYLKSTQILSKWLEDTNSTINYLELPDFDSFPSSIYSNTYMINAHLSTFVYKDLLYAASVDNTMKDHTANFISANEHSRKKYIASEYKNSLKMTNAYCSLLQKLSPVICFLSHGNYIEYVSLLVASNMMNVTTKVFHGGFAHKYLVHNLNWGQPGPINSLNQLLACRQGGYNFLRMLPKSTRKSLNIELDSLEIESDSNIVAYGGRDTKNSLILTLKQLKNDSNEFNISNNHVIICLHCLTDQNHNFETSSSLHRTYFEWTIDLMNHIDSSCKITVKIHPHSDKFGETSLISDIVRKIADRRNLNYEIIGPKSDLASQSHFLNDQMPITITCGGTIAIEMAAQGLVCTTSTESLCSDDISLRFKNLSLYRRSISDINILRHMVIEKMKSLSPKQIREARAVLDIMDIPNSGRNTLPKLKAFDKYYFFGKSSSSDIRLFSHDLCDYHSSYQEFICHSTNVDYLIESNI